MRYGMPTMLEFDNLKDNLEAAVAAKADFFELNLNFPYIERELKQSPVKALLDSYNLEYTLHFYDEVDFGLDSELIKGYIEAFINWCSIGRALGIRSINIHLNPGRVVTINGVKNYLNDIYYRTYLNNLLFNLRTLSDAAKKNLMELTVENIESAPFMKEALTEVSKRYSVTYDVGHDYTTGNILYSIYKDKKPFEMHLHDAKDSVCHLPLGSGEINLDSYLELCSVRTYIVIEVKCYKDFVESIAKLRDRT